MQLIDSGCVATTGFFDGVHTGHRLVLTRLKEMGARFGLPVCVVTFWPHPRIVLNSQPEQLRLLTTLDEKIKLLKNFGIDRVEVLNFSKELSETSAEEFVHEILVKNLRVKALCVGYDHRLGRGGAGYEEIKQICQFNAISCERVEAASQRGEIASSQKIRKFLQNARPDIACELLGRPYSLSGTVVHGKKLGRQIGFPTANISTDDFLKLIPSAGVYASRIMLCDRIFDGMLYIGRRPTVNTLEEITVEANIFDFDEDLYGKKLTVTFENYLRDDIRFASINELVAQLNRDKDSAKQKLNP